MGGPAKCWLVSAMLCWNGAVYNKATDISQQVYGPPCYYTCSSTEPKAQKVSLKYGSLAASGCLSVHTFKHEYLRS